jgi:hypothetical protein
VVKLYDKRCSNGGINSLERRSYFLTFMCNIMKNIFCTTIFGPCASDMFIPWYLTIIWQKLEWHRRICHQFWNKQKNSSNNSPNLISGTVSAFLVQIYPAYTSTWTWWPAVSGTTSMPALQHHGRILERFIETTHNLCKMCGLHPKSLKPTSNKRPTPINVWDTRPNLEMAEF